MDCRICCGTVDDNCVMRSFARYLFLKFGAIFGNSKPKVVFYHDIGKKYTSMGTPEEVFWAHIQYLRRGDVVCFDDGFWGV